MKTTEVNALRANPERRYKPPFLNDDENPSNFRHFNGLQAGRDQVLSAGGALLGGVGVSAVNRAFFDFFGETGS